MIDDSIQYEEIEGEIVYYIDAKWYSISENELSDAKLGILKSDLMNILQRGQATAIAQFYKLVVNGTILTKHIFNGLKRPLSCDNSDNGDKHKLIYVRKPTYDYIWQGNKSDGKPVEKDAPIGCVLVVLVSPNILHRGKYPKVKGWIERWSWIKEDPGLAQAPINWVDRYDKKVCTL